MSINFCSQSEDHENCRSELLKPKWWWWCSTQTV